MTFWQENYGFVKEVYDFRMTKYQEWMDNLDAIVKKVLAQDVQYSYKEFKIIQDSLGSLCRDLEKEGMKEWLDMMLEKVAVRVSEDGLSARDKEFKNIERKRLQALIDRHDKLMPPTKETQEKVEIYARCYAFGDDISQTMKCLEEMLHLSVKEIHPHNMNMVEEQIEKSEKIITTVEGCQSDFEDYLKRGQKLLRTPNCAPFLTPLIEKLEVTWKAANEKSKERLTWLTNAVKDWEKYDELRTTILDPCDRLDSELKKYRKYYDAEMGLKNLQKRKNTLEEAKVTINEQFEHIKKCYGTIVVLAGDDKKEFLDKEVSEVGERKSVIEKCEAALLELMGYQGKLDEAVKSTKELNDWAIPTDKKLKQVCTGEDLSPEDRVKEILLLQDETRKTLPKIAPLEESFKQLLTEEDFEKSETARNTLADFEETKKFVVDVCADIETEAGSISEDQRFFADYLCGVRDFKPWVEEAVAEAKKPLEKPSNLEAALALLTTIETFNTLCVEKKEGLTAAAKARDSMEKQPTTAANDIDPLAKQWEGVKQNAVTRIEKVKVLVETWTQLQSTTEDLAAKMNEVPKQDEPDLQTLEKVFNSMKDLFAKKKELLVHVQ